MLKHVSFCFCVCCVTCIHVVSDSVCFFYHLGVFFVSIQQSFVFWSFFSDFIDVGVVCRVVSVVVAVNFLTEVVLWVTVVSAPTVQSYRVQVWNVNLLSTALDEGVDRQFNKVVAQAVAEALCQYVCGVKSILVGSLNIVIQLYWEGYAQSGQFFQPYPS